MEVTKELEVMAQTEDGVVEAVMSLDYPILAAMWHPERDQKGLYSGAKAGKEDLVVGIHMEFEKPQCPDLVLLNDGQKSPEEQARVILSHTYQC